MENILQVGTGAFGRQFYLSSSVSFKTGQTEWIVYSYRVTGCRCVETFATLAEAEEYFAKYTTPIVAVEA